MKAFLGMDISKGYCDFVLINEKKETLEKDFELDDTHKGHQKLKEWMQEIIQGNGIEALYCGVESTGGYENNWYSAVMEWSKNMPVFIARLNPSGVKNNIAAGLNRNITDGKSAQYIAEYLISHPDKADYKTQNTYYCSFRSHNNYIRMLNKQKTQLTNQMKFLLQSSFPELLIYCKKSIPVWVLHMLVKYPDLAKIAAMKPEMLARIKNVGMTKAKAIIEKAQKSVASRKGKMQAVLIEELAKDILSRQISIERMKKALENECKGEEVTLLQSIKGIGAYSAAAIMTEIEDIERFASPKELASYFGLHPEWKQSGDKIACRMSKKGRSTVRAVLYMCAMSAVVHDAHMKTIYHKHRSKCKTHNQAIGVIMHKLLRICWGVLKSKNPYDIAVDKAYQEKKVNSKKEGKRG